MFIPCIVHGHGHVMFAEECVGHHGDCGFGDHLLDKDGTGFPFAIVFVADIKSQVDFGKRGVEWNREAFDLSVHKPESDDADVAGVVPDI